MKAPKKVNGYPIMLHHYTPAGPMTRAGHVIMVDRGETSPERYVTAWLGAGDSSWWQGHYFDDLDSANADYWERVRRYN